MGVGYGRGGWGRFYEGLFCKPPNRKVHKVDQGTERVPPSLADMTEGNQLPLRA